MDIEFIELLVPENLLEILQSFLPKEIILLSAKEIPLEDQVSQKR